MRRCGNPAMLKDALLAGLALYAFCAAGAWFFSDRMIFLPPEPSYDARSLPVTLVPAEDGAGIAVLHLPNPAAEYTILFSHGNAEDLGHGLPFLEELRAAGFGVLAYDYRGYGASSKSKFPTARGANLDQLAVYRHAVGTLNIPPEKLILHGRSVGNGPALALAAREPVAGVIVESGFVSAFRVLTRVQLLPFDKFPNLRLIRQLRAPLLLIHGTGDEIIPLWHGQALFAAAPEPKTAFWANGAGHNDLALVAGEDYLSAIRDFARGLSALSAGSADTSSSSAGR